LDQAIRPKEEIMVTAKSEAQSNAPEHELQAHACAYNMAFAELNLRFRWDAQTLALLISIDGDEACIAAYIEAHHAHLLTAYSAEFLSRAILERKNAYLSDALPRTAQPNRPRSAPADIGNMSHAYEFSLPALWGA
jgi:hypothetical protein